MGQVREEHLTQTTHVQRRVPLDLQLTHVVLGDSAAVLQEQLTRLGVNRYNFMLEL